MSDLHRSIISALYMIPASDAATLAQDLGEHPRAVQEALHALDDSGHVTMRNGIYRLSEAARQGRLPMPGVQA